MTVGAAATAFVLVCGCPQRGTANSDGSDWTQFDDGITQVTNGFKFLDNTAESDLHFNLSYTLHMFYDCV